MFGGGAGVRIPLEPVTNLALVGRDASVIISWTDPVDKYTTPGDELVSEWDYTIIVRKQGSAPASPSDGTIVVKEETRNQYQSTGYTDTGLTNGATYYYAAYAYATLGMRSDPTVNSVQPDAAQPQFYTYAPSLNGVNRNFVGRSSGTNYALFVGGSYTGGSTSNNIDAYSASLTKTMASDHNRPSANMQGGFTGDYHVVIAPVSVNPNQNACAYSDSSLAKSDLTTFAASYTAIIASESFNGNAIFAGGNLRSGGGYTTAVYRYDSSLSYSSMSSLSLARDGIHSAANNDYVLFAGGRSTTGTVSDRYPYNTVDAYNSSLTKVSVTPLSVARHSNLSNGSGGGVSVGEFLLFAGGMDSRAADAYNASLTRTTVTSLPSFANIGDEILRTIATPSGLNALVCVNGYSTESSGFVWYDPSLTQHTDGIGAPSSKSYYNAAIVGGYSLYANVSDSTVSVFRCI